MAKSDSKIVAVCDAGPIIYLDELNCLDLLSDFHSLLIPKAVQREVEKHRFNALQHPRIIFKTIDVVSPPEPKLLVLSKALLLDKGELESLSLIQENQEAIFLTDDAAARLAGEELGYKVHGTIGIILRAIRKKIKTPKEVVELLRDCQIITFTFCISSSDHLCPIFIHKTFKIAQLFLRFCSIRSAKSGLNLSAECKSYYLTVP